MYKLEIKDRLAIQPVPDNCYVFHLTSEEEVKLDAYEDYTNRVVRIYVSENNPHLSDFLKDVVDTLEIVPNTPITDNPLYKWTNTTFNSSSGHDLILVNWNYNPDGNLYELFDVEVTYFDSEGIEHKVDILDEENNVI